MIRPDQCGHSSVIGGGKSLQFEFLIIKVSFKNSTALGSCPHYRFPLKKRAGPLRNPPNYIGIHFH